MKRDLKTHDAEEEEEDLVDDEDDQEQRDNAMLSDWERVV